MQQLCVFTNLQRGLFKGASGEERSDLLVQDPSVAIMSYVDLVRLISVWLRLAELPRGHLTPHGRQHGGSRSTSTSGKPLKAPFKLPFKPLPFMPFKPPLAPFFQFLLTSLAPDGPRLQSLFWTQRKNDACVFLLVLQCCMDLVCCFRVYMEVCGKRPQHKGRERETTDGIDLLSVCI